MSERNLSRRLATSIVDALKARGHILVARGGATALARELEDKMSDDIETIAPRLEPWGLVDGEVTTTFGADEVDDQVEELVAALTATLVESEHVEDVFAEDNVIKRDVFRVMRDALLGPRRGLIYDDDGPVLVRLDMLGYVASTVGKRAQAGVLREALTRAAQAVGGKLTGYDPDAREATFSIQGGDPDARLELEEAVADELAELVNVSVVSLPTVERCIDLPHALAAAPRATLRQRINAAVARTIRQGGCAATWELEGERTLKVKVTPLSEQDALEVDRHVSVLAREIAAAPSDVAGEVGVARQHGAAPTDDDDSFDALDDETLVDDDAVEDVDEEDADEEDADEEDVDEEDADEEDADEDEEDVGGAEEADDEEREDSKGPAVKARARTPKKAAAVTKKTPSAAKKKAAAPAKKAAAAAKNSAVAKKTTAAAAKRATTTPAKKTAAAKKAPAPAAKKPAAKKR